MLPGVSPSASGFTHPQNLTYRALLAKVPEHSVPPKHSAEFKKQVQWHFNMISVTLRYSAPNTACNSLCCKAGLDIRQTLP